MKLDLYSGREPHIIETEIDGEKKSFKFASDFTVEEFERIYEFESQQKEDLKHDERWSIMYNQILIGFKRYNPEMTTELLKKYFTQRELLKIINFMTTNSFGGVSEKNEDGLPIEGSKKKDQMTTSKH